MNRSPELVNRLSALRSSPGWNDLLTISKELVDQTVQNVEDYEGWDPEQLTILVARMQAAKQHHKTLFGHIMTVINEGLAQEMDQVNSQQTEEQIKEADRLREAMMEYANKQATRPIGL